MEKYPTDRTFLQPNDLLVIYTDGVTEARNEEESNLAKGAYWRYFNQERAAVTLAGIMKKLDDLVGSAAPA